MGNITKNKIDNNGIANIFRKHFKENTVVDSKELTEGFYNSAYKVRLDNGDEYILKTAPSKAVKVMTYEKNLINTEVMAMKLAARNNLPVAKCAAFDEECDVCNAPYFIMSVLPGQSLSSLSYSIDEETNNQIMYDLGKLNSQINGITGEKFGYPGFPKGQDIKWYPVFRTILEDAVNDGIRVKVELGIDIEDLFEKLEQSKNIFDTVTVPSLVHWDLWAGNIFIKDNRISGIIDWERCIWADPLMELGFRTYDCNEMFLKGYGKEQLSDNEYQRALWYDIYLLIIMSVEGTYRHYDNDEQYNWAQNVLKEIVGKI